MAIAAIISTVLLALLALFQIALAAGAPLGHFAWGGQHRVLPASLRMSSTMSVLIYAIIAALQLDRGGVIEVVPDVFSVVACWFFVAYFALGIVLNAISRSRPERLTMTPVVAVLTVLALLVALG